jgi:hypothetical protein
MQDLASGCPAEDQAGGSIVVLRIVLFLDHWMFAMKYADGSLEVYYLPAE